MSWETQSWAAKQRPGSASAKLVLLGLASCADANHCAFPSIQWLCEFSDLNRKTVIAAIDRLEGPTLSLIEDTGERRGRTGQVKVYRLAAAAAGAPGDPASESIPKAEQFQKRNSSVFGSKESQKRDTEPVSNPITPPPPKGGVPPKVENSGEGKATRAAEPVVSGGRLSDDWAPPPISELTGSAAKLVRQWPPGAYEAACETFRLHWLSESGARGRKRDWGAALAKWLIGDHAKIMRDAKAGVSFAHLAEPSAKTDGVSDAARSASPPPPVPERALEGDRELAVRQAIARASDGQEPAWLARAGIRCSDISGDGQVVGLKVFVPAGQKDHVEQQSRQVMEIANRGTSFTVKWVSVETTRAKQAA